MASVPTVDVTSFIIVSEYHGIRITFALRKSFSCCLLNGTLLKVKLNAKTWLICRANESLEDEELRK